jgi:hypothetical protein
MVAKRKSAGTRLAVVGFDVVAFGAFRVVVMTIFANTRGVPRCNFSHNRALLRAHQVDELRYNGGGRGDRTPFQ